jgi:hypothetical protein
LGGLVGGEAERGAWRAGRLRDGVGWEGYVRVRNTAIEVKQVGTSLLGVLLDIMQSRFLAAGDKERVGTSSIREN